MAASAPLTAEEQEIADEVRAGLDDIGRRLDAIAHRGSADAATFAELEDIRGEQRRIGERLGATRA